MNLMEMFNEAPKGYQTPGDDKTPLKISDVRKTKLTLNQLNRLRVMNDIRKLEQEQKLEAVQAQYQVTADSNQGLM